MKKGILLLLLFCLSLCVFAEGNSDTSAQSKANHYLNISSGLIYVHYKDYVVSPLTYNSVGFFPFFEAELEGRKINRSGFTSLLINNRLLNTDVASLNHTGAEEYLQLKLANSNCYQLTNFFQNKVRYRLGYSANFEYNHQINLRLENAAYTFAIWVNGGVANRFEFPFAIPTEKKIGFIRFRQPRQNLLLSWQVNLPLITLITRPNLSGIRHFANGEFINPLLDEMADHLKVVSLNQFIEIQSQLELQLPLGNNNRLKLAYLWEGFRYNREFEKVQSTNGGFLIGLMFRLDSREEVQ